MAQFEKSKRKNMINQNGSKAPVSRKSPLQKKIEKQAARKKVSSGDVLRLCKEGLSLEDMSCNLGLSTLSVATYIERLLRKGASIDIGIFVSSQKRHEIEEVFLEMQTLSIKRIAEYLYDKATVEEIRIVRGYLQYRQNSEIGGEFY